MRSARDALLPLDRSSSRQRTPGSPPESAPLQDESNRSTRYDSEGVTFRATESEETPAAEDHHGKRHWTPFWLRKSTLLAFVVLYTAIAAALIVVWQASRSRNGFSVAAFPNHYAWTYGPTAILIIVLSLWRQVDYSCKIMQPWQELRKGPTKADNSVLLDYVSPMFVTSLITATRRRHYPVAASVAGFIMLKAIILLSTALLVLTPTKSERIGPVALTTNFDADRCVPQSWYDDGDVYLGFINDGSQFDTKTYDVSSLPAFTYAGIQDGRLSSPKDTQDGLTFQSFKLLSNQSVRSVAANVSVLKPRITCETAEISLSSYLWSNFLTTLEYHERVQLKTETCLVGAQSQPVFTAAGEDTCNFQCPRWQMELSLKRVSCTPLPPLPPISSLTRSSPTLRRTFDTP